jgi:hypothetical protein
LQDSDRPVVPGNSDGPIPGIIEEAVKMKARMMRITLESSVCGARCSANLRRQFIVEFPETGQGL